MQPVRETIWSERVATIRRINDSLGLNDLLKSLVPAALHKIDLAQGDEAELMALQLVDDQGDAAALPPERRQAVHASLLVFKQRRELGLEKMQLPHEFICPITQEKMKGQARPLSNQPACSIDPSD